MNKKRLCFNNISFEQIVQGIILFAFGIIFLYSVISKKALQYVHIRHTGIIIFASIIFFIISFLKFRNIFSIKHESKKTFPFYTIAFILPILFACIIPYKPLTLDSLAFHTEIFSQQQQHVPQLPPKPVSPRLPELHDGYVIMDDDSFGRWLPELYLNLDSWTDKKIKIEGAVWKNSEILGEKEFAIGRMMMVCCAADMQPAGLIANWQEADSLSDDDWVRITGTISKIEYEGSFEPLILVEKAEKIKRPALEYVYPF